MKTGFVLAIAAYVAALWAAGLGVQTSAREPGVVLPGLAAARRRPRRLLPLRLLDRGGFLLVSTDEAFRDGVSAIWIIGVPAVVTLLVLTALVRPVRAVVGLTPSGLMRDRYGKAAGALTTILDRLVHDRPRGLPDGRGRALSRAPS